MLSNEWQWLLGQIQTPNQLAELVGALCEAVKEMPLMAGVERVNLVRSFESLHIEVQRYTIAHQKEVMRRNMARS